MEEEVAKIIGIAGYAELAVLILDLDEGYLPLLDRRISNQLIEVYSLSLDGCKSVTGRG